ncbi:Hypothetical protein PHPALM_8919 [Phytophthora palmivora]|uniref:Uncharacterized protein n=1 Tax=Phytophthora palmivora TaxID=4796 RepID=A0A2P4Y8N7_9STRA|nr:Hypothetical protein PHPALM_8919 [Phytophthora palmivora]
MNTRDFPVLVFGISDRTRSFLLKALFVVSQQGRYVLFKVYMFVLPTKNCCCGMLWGMLKPVSEMQFVKHLETNQGCNSSCAFSCLLNVSKYIQGFSGYDKASLMQDIYDLHFASGQTEALVIRYAILKKWKCYPLLAELVAYMESQWLFGAICLWQTYANASGFATTNNPVKQFNGF